MCRFIALWGGISLLFERSYSSSPSNQIYMTKVADFNSISFIDHIYCPSGASSRLDVNLAVSTWCACHLSGSWQGTWRHSGVPSTGLFNYHRAGRNGGARGSWPQWFRPVFHPHTLNLLRRICYLGSSSEKDVTWRWQTGTLQTHGG